MDKIVMTMVDFMVKHGPYLGWPPSKLEEMAKYSSDHEEDFVIIIRNVHHTIPKLSIDEYFKKLAEVEKAERAEKVEWEKMAKTEKTVLPQI
jgi:hypothetical protein